jgi:predicted N-acyltransferase
VICRFFNSKIQKGSDKIYFDIFNSIGEFSKLTWDKIAGENKFLHSNYLKALEKTLPAGISFRYCIMHENKIPVAICYFQIADLTSKELGSLIDFDNYGNIISAVGNKINKVLFAGNKFSSNNLLVCGSLFISGEHGIACADQTFFPVCVKLIPEVMEIISRQIEEKNGRVVCFSVKDFYDPSDVSAKVLLQSRFHRMVIDPNMIFFIKKDWIKFDDYLDAMSAKYRLRANNVMKKLEALQMRYLTAEDIEAEKESLEKLYLQVQKKAPVKIVRVNYNYFHILKSRLKDEFVLRAFYLKGKMIAFTSGFKFGDHYEAHFIGIDYHYNKSYSLYQNILYDFIHEAIKNKSTQLVFGRTAMEIKSTVGAAAYPLYSYLKFSNKFLNSLIKPFIPSEKNENWIPRNPFKD